MSLLSGIIKGESPHAAKQLAHLINIIKAFGWNALNDNRTIKPNMRQAQLYIRKNADLFKKLFPTIKENLSNIKKGDVVDIINPLLIEMWHVQIIGNIDNASLELLRPINKIT